MSKKLFSSNKILPMTLKKVGIIENDFTQHHNFSTELINNLSSYKTEIITVEMFVSSRISQVLLLLFCSREQNININTANKSVRLYLPSGQANVPVL